MDVSTNPESARAATAGDLAVGRIISVTGAQAVVLLEDNHAKLSREDRPEMGTLLKVDTPDSIVLGLICALAVPMPSQEPDGGELCIGEVEFIGELL